MLAVFGLFVKTWPDKHETWMTTPTDVSVELTTWENDFDRHVTSDSNDRTKKIDWVTIIGKHPSLFGFILALDLGAGDHITQFTTTLCRLVTCDTLCRASPFHVWRQIRNYSATAGAQTYLRLRGYFHSNHQCWDPLSQLGCRHVHMSTRLQDLTIHARRVNSSIALMKFYDYISRLAKLVTTFSTEWPQK